MRRRSSYYLRERRRGRTFSLLLHLLILLLCVIGLPSFLTSPPPEEPYAITVELVPVTGITNIRPAERAQEPKATEKKSAQKKPAPPVKIAEETPPDQNRVPLPKPKEKKETRKQIKEEKKNPEKQKPKPDDLAAVLKAVKDTAEKEDQKTKHDSAHQSKNISSQYNPQLPMSISETDAIRSQIARCWNVPAGARDAQNLVVVLRIQLEPDGSVTKVELASGNESRYNSDSFFRAAADSAMRAVRECSPLKKLPPQKYQTWHDMELTFDPKDMLL
ncbi:MAG: TonB C-terminal domain-containing protein [Pseudomonadota bacterium]|nr:TonB C-terminal domain-containing protein [Pseudomonadota bacterium]MDE3037968.1 TonB C-terminal domain-containing protein [Pseudomonadota bacterium]